MIGEDKFDTGIFQESETTSKSPTIKVIGIGGGGISAVNHMIASGIQNIEYIVVDCDEQALLLSKTDNRINIGKKISGGLGIVAQQDIEMAAKEAKDVILEHLRGVDLIFIIVGMGGSTGTGAAPIVAQCAREAGALTVGVVTKPFSFEGKRRMNQAEAGIVNLKERVDTLITISNDRLLQIVDRRTNMQDVFRITDDVLRQGVQGISDVVSVPSPLNADFEDLKTVMSNAGFALLGVGTAKGENGAVIAAKEAIKSPLLDDITFEEHGERLKGSIGTAHGVLFNITGGKDMTMYDVTEAADIISENVCPDANIVFGAIFNDKMEKNEFQVKVIAVDFSLKNVDRHKSSFGGYGGVIDDPRYKESVSVPPWMRGKSKERETKGVEAEDLVPRPDGKSVCNYLRKLRVELAQANNIPFESKECTFEGQCAGTCAKCDSEASYLRDKLNEIPEEERKYPPNNLEDWEKAL